jgi:hypothetical protein
MKEVCSRLLLAITKKLLNAMPNK